jgi:hypothetical protein
MQNLAISPRNSIEDEKTLRRNLEACCEGGRNLPKAFHNTAASNFSSWNDFYASAITGLKRKT